MVMLYLLTLMTPDLKRSWQEVTGRISRTWANKEQKSKKKRREGVREGGMEGMGRGRVKGKEERSAFRS